jgi:hypothetical protein
MLYGLRLILLLVSSILFIGCPDECYPGGFLSITHYNVGEYKKSPGGIKVYNDYHSIDLLLIDIKVEELESCLNIKINRDCFAVLIPNDWFYSSCQTGEQLLPVEAPLQLCLDKDPTMPIECGCYWRVALQDDYYIVSPPNLKLLKAELSRLVTNENNPWASSEISRCLL